MLLSCSPNFPRASITRYTHAKGGEIRDTKTLNLAARNMSKFVARKVEGLMKNEQESQNLLLKVDPRSTFCNKFLQPATNVFVADQVDHAR